MYTLYYLCCPELAYFGPSPSHCSAGYFAPTGVNVQINVLRSGESGQDPVKGGVTQKANDGKDNGEEEKVKSKKSRTQNQAKHMEKKSRERNLGIEP